MSTSPPDVIVSWLQNDYGQLGRPAESIAHALQDSGLARQVAYMEPQVVSPGPATMDIDTNRGVHVYRLSGQRADGCEVAQAVVSNSGLKDPILLNFGVDTPNWWFHSALAPVTSSTALITHDVLELWPGMTSARSQHLRRIRNLLLSASEHVIGLSMGSIQDVEGATYVGHGCDPGMDSPAIEDLPEPLDLARVPHPRALYFGALSYRIEVPALAALANSGVHVVLIGFSPSPAMQQLIDSHPFVHALGPRPPGASRAYLRHCDIGVVPHTDDPFTWTMEPHKVYNYSCAGLRSILLNCAAPGPLAGLVCTANDTREFVEKCHQQLAAGRLPSAEVALARSLTWTRVAGQLLEVVDGIPRHSNSLSVDPAVSLPQGEG